MTPEEVRTHYGLGDWYRSVAIGVHGLGVPGVVVWFVFLIGHGTPIAALACLLPAAVLIGGVQVYLRLWRWPYRLDIRGDAIEWRTPLRRGRIPIRALYSIERESRLSLHNGFRRVLFRPFDGMTLVLPQYLNLGPFVQQLRAIEPRIEVLPPGWAKDLGVTTSSPTPP